MLAIICAIESDDIPGGIIPWGLMPDDASGVELCGVVASCAGVEFSAAAAASFFFDSAASIKGLELGGLLPGIKVNTSATDFAPLSQLQLMKFKGDTWELFGEILAGDVGG